LLLLFVFQIFNYYFAKFVYFADKRRYSSSCFYGQSESKFPTIEEQVEMCRKIASQLVNEENLNSRGSTMFHKRVKRAPKWVHQSSLSQEESNLSEDENKQIESMKQRLKEEQKKSLKLILDPRMIKTVESLKKSGTSFNEHNAVSPEVCLHLVKELNTPDINKGAKIFMKRKEKSIEWEVDENQASKQIREEKERKEQEASQWPAYKPSSIFYFQDSRSQKSNKVMNNNNIFSLNSNLKDTRSRDSYTGNVYSTLPQANSGLFQKSTNNSSLTSRFQINRDLCLPRTPKGWIPKAASMESLQFQPQFCKPNYYQQVNLKTQKESRNVRYTLLNSDHNLLAQSPMSFNLKSKSPITLPKYRNFNSTPKGFCKQY